MLKRTFWVFLPSVVLILAGGLDDVRAHSCLHTRVKCKTFSSTTKAEFVHPHTQAGQYLNAKCFKTGGGLGFHAAEAFAHSSQHTNGNTHFNGWGWSAGFSSYSWHASHGHCSSSDSLDDSSKRRPVLVPPPDRANTEGAFVFLNVESMNESGGVVLEFLPGSRLQVDRRGLVRPKDKSHSSLVVGVEKGIASAHDHSDTGSALGRIVLSVKGDGSRKLLMDGIFSPDRFDAAADVPEIASAHTADNPDLVRVNLEGLSVRIPDVDSDSAIAFDVFGFHDGNERDRGRIWEGTDD